jgi:hypothetical protein
MSSAEIIKLLIYQSTHFSEGELGCFWRVSTHFSKGELW